jgi:hypothetical protein
MSYLNLLYKNNANIISMHGDLIELKALHAKLTDMMGAYKRSIYKAQLAKGLIAPVDNLVYVTVNDQGTDKEEITTIDVTELIHISVTNKPLQ